MSYLSQNRQNQIRRLEKDLEDLKEEYEVISQQKNSALSTVDSVRLDRQLTTIEQQMEKVCADLDRLCGGSQNFLSELEGEVPRLLPYSANRSRQEDDLDEALEEYKRSGRKRPILCIIHGNEYQCHREFIDRLEKEILPRLLELNKKDCKVHGYHLEWPDEKADRSKFRQQLRNRVLKKLTGKCFNSLEDLNLDLNKHNPTLIRSQFMTGDWLQYRFNVLEAFLEFWQDWPELNLGQIMIICLCIRYENAKGSGFFKCFSAKNKLNQKIVQALDNLHQKQPDRLIIKVLTELHGITRTEAEDWIDRMSPKLSQFVPLPDLRDAIRGLYQSAERISMDELAKGLAHLLSNDRINY